MIISTMTNDEIYKEMREDFWELRNIMLNIADKCIRDNKILQDRFHFIPPTGSKKSYTTKKNKNNWTIEWHIISYNVDHHLSIIFISYTTCVDRAGKSHYAVLAHPEKFAPMIVSSHFLKRYRERYIEPHHIKLGGESLLAYFIMHNKLGGMVSYFPKNWTEKDKENKRVHYCEHGLFVLLWMRDDFPLLITFLDESCLTEYKAQVYKAESFTMLFHKYLDITLRRKKEYDIIQRHAILQKLVSFPNAKELMVDFFKREKEMYPDDKEMLDVVSEKAMKYWDSLVTYSEEFERETKDLESRQRLQQCYADMLFFGEIKEKQITTQERKELLNILTNPEKQKFIPYDHEHLSAALAQIKKMLGNK